MFLGEVSFSSTSRGSGLFTYTPTSALFLFIFGVFVFFTFETVAPQGVEGLVSYNQNFVDIFVRLHRAAFESVFRMIPLTNEIIAQSMDALSPRPADLLQPSAEELATPVERGRQAAKEFFISRTRSALQHRARAGHQFYS